MAVAASERGRGRAPPGAGEQTRAAVMCAGRRACRRRHAQCSRWHARVCRSFDRERARAAATFLVPEGVSGKRADGGRLVPEREGAAALPRSLEAERAAVAVPSLGEARARQGAGRTAIAAEVASTADRDAAPPLAARDGRRAAAAARGAQAWGRDGAGAAARESRSRGRGDRRSIADVIAALGMAVRFVVGQVDNLPLEGVH